METLSSLLTATLVPLVGALAVLWAALSLFLIGNSRAARHRAAVVQRTLTDIAALESSGKPPEDQVRDIEHLVARLERLMLLRVAASLPDRSPLSEVFA